MKKLLVCAIMSLLLHGTAVVPSQEVQSSVATEELSTPVTDFVITTIATPRVDLVNKSSYKYTVAFNSVDGFVDIDMTVHYPRIYSLDSVQDIEQAKDQFTQCDITIYETYPARVVYHYTSHIPVEIFSKKLQETK